MALWLLRPEDRPPAAVHLAEHRGDGWRSLCWRLQAAWGREHPGMFTVGDWRGRGGEKPCELVGLGQVPEGRHLCGACLRAWRRDAAEVRDLVACSDG